MKHSRRGRDQLDNSQGETSFGNVPASKVHTPTTSSAFKISNRPVHTTPRSARKRFPDSSKARRGLETEALTIVSTISVPDASHATDGEKTISK